MRLATIYDGQQALAAVLRDTTPIRILNSDGAPYADVRHLLEAGDAGTSHAREALASGGPVEAGWRFLRPVLDPRATWCVGLNYRAHILETGHEPPSAPVWFGKFSAALTDPDVAVIIPSVDDTIDYEGEVAIIIGRVTRDIGVEEAWDSVAGVTLFNDDSARTLARVRQNVFFGKNLERSSAVGPIVVTPEELGEFEALRFELRVNGELRQNGNASDLLFDVPALVADVASITTLWPGDIIATGTPGGVGIGFDPPRWLLPGDVVEISSSAIGVLRSRFV